MWDRKELEKHVFYEEAKKEILGDKGYTRGPAEEKRQDELKRVAACINKMCEEADEDIEVMS